MISKGENSFHECKLYDSLPSRDINPTAPAPRRKLRLMNKKSLCQGDRDPGTCHPCFGTQQRAETPQGFQSSGSRVI